MKVMNTQILANAMQDPTKFGQLYRDFSSHRDVWILWDMRRHERDISIVSFLDGLPQGAVDALYAIHPHQWKGNRSVSVWVDHAQRKAFLAAVPPQTQAGGWYCRFVNWMKDVPAPLGVAPSRSVVTGAEVTRNAHGVNPRNHQAKGATPTPDGEPRLPRPMPPSSSYERWAAHCVSGKRIRTQCKGMDHYVQGSDPPLSVGDSIVLVPDPHNEVDRNAIRVESAVRGASSGGFLWGHLPAKLAHELALVLPKNARLVGNVTKDRKGHCQAIDVWIEEDRPQPDAQSASVGRSASFPRGD
jgi:hypothetical protein